MTRTTTVEEALEHRARLRKEPEENIHYTTWLEDYLATLEGKEARLEYYAWLEEELARLRGSKKED